MNIIFNMTDEEIQKLGINELKALSYVAVSVKERSIIEYNKSLELLIKLDEIISEKMENQYT